MLVDKAPHRHGHGGAHGPTRRGSGESLNSLRSFRSGSSGKSGKSEADRIIDAIQEPHMVRTQSVSTSEARSQGVVRSLSKGSAENKIHRRPPPIKRSHTFSNWPSSQPPSHRDSSASEMESSPSRSIPGTEEIEGSGTPLKAVRVPEEMMRGRVYAEAPMVASAHRQVTFQGPAASTREQLSAHHLNVLVAEDDPINSKHLQFSRERVPDHIAGKIIKKRLEKLGHHVFLTGNGQECCSAYCEESSAYDVVLMDMQVRTVLFMSEHH